MKKKPNKPSRASRRRKPTRAIRIRTAIPGPQSIRLMMDRGRQVPRGPFHVTPIFVKRARGSIVEDVDGNHYIDFTGGLGTLNVGHCAPDVVRAVKEQASNFLHTCFHVAPYASYVELAKTLNGLTPGRFAKKTLLVNSGAEAVENAIKIARYATKRQAILAFEHGFHGRTLLALSLTSKVRPYKFGFGPYAPEVYRIPYPDVYRRPDGMTEEDFIEESLLGVRHFFKSHVDAEQIAAVIMELVTGEGGFLVAPKRYVQGLADICRENGILFIADEVQSGFGRTGYLFASEYYGLQPDMITMAKSLAGGMPLAAVTGRAELMDAVHVGGLGGTFGGNPVGCQAALAVLQTMRRQRLLERSRRLGEKLKKRLEHLREKIPLIGDVRGLGSMRAIELVRDRKTKEPANTETTRVIQLCYESGLLVLSCGLHGNVLRLLMPLSISDAELEEGLAVLETALAQVAAS
ncbi:MAG: 4-aminobutyrate--2-oxoglutarate transaminase [Verrucomicrobiae bacterium]|nr:4-aminobutyrate--2-oxoglutarate transaminase [Verrucomicrobiae bacterium]